MRRHMLPLLSSHIIAATSLALPAMIVLLYPRDSSTPLARIEVGAAAGDGFSRYALLAGTVVRVADHDVKRLTDLLKAVGAAT